MKKLMVASDIHGSALYCKKMLEAFAASGAERLLLLGDLLYHGPRNALPAAYDPPAVIEMLNAHRERILAVRGNCEAEVDQMVLTFLVMADYALIDLPFGRIYATHGHLHGPSSPPPLVKGDILLFGHTHVPTDRVQDGIRLLNPGSVSIPKEQSPHSCLFIEGETVTFYDLEKQAAYLPVAQ